MSRLTVVALVVSGLALFATSECASAKPWCTGTLLIRHAFYGEPDWYSKVTLSGRVTQKIVLGAPGYGESPRIDDRIRVAFLHLDHPVRMLLRDLDSFDPRKTVPGTVTVIQLVQMATKGAIDPFSRRNPHVTAEGVLYMGDGTLSLTAVTFVERGKIWLSRTSTCNGELIKH
jgi:hypothetical protein